MNEWEEREAADQERDRILELSMKIKPRIRPCDITYVRLENGGWTPEMLDAIGINEGAAINRTERIWSLIVTECVPDEVEDVIDCLAQICQLTDCPVCAGPVCDYEKHCESCGAENPEFDDLQFHIVRGAAYDDFIAAHCSSEGPHLWGPDEDIKHCHACGKPLLPLNEKDPE